MSQYLGQDRSVPPIFLTEVGVGAAVGTEHPISLAFRPTDPFTIQLTTFITTAPLSITDLSFITIARWLFGHLT